MSELIPNILALDKGLDLQSPKLTAPPGSVLDSLNYEQVDFQGQKRIDGYTRYDGSPLSAVKDVYLVHGLSSIDYGIYRLAVNYNGVPYGVVTDVYTNPPFNNAIAVFDEAALTEEYNGVWASALSDYANDPAEHQALVNEVNRYLRNRVEDLTGPISGLHWFRDRLYAVVDIENYYGVDSRIDQRGLRGSHNKLPSRWPRSRNLDLPIEIGGSSTSCFGYQLQVDLVGHERQWQYGNG